MNRSMIPIEIENGRLPVSMVIPSELAALIFPWMSSSNCNEKTRRERESFTCALAEDGANLVD